MTSLPVDAGLMERFRAAGTKIRWREVIEAGRGRARPAKTRVRIAHLNDEEARVEAQEIPGGLRLTVDSGPVGALVVLLEADSRGPPGLLAGRDAGTLPAFTQGAIEAGWGPAAHAPPGALGLPDLVALARYALA